MIVESEQICLEGAVPRVAIIGAGLVGLASAYQLSRRYKGAQITIFEKEAAPAQHQSGRNSGVLHTGVYYRPGTLKAKLCHEGRASLIEFCANQGVPLKITGKLIVATTDLELSRLREIGARAAQNGVQARLISSHEAVEIEPHVGGVGALHVPDAGVVSFSVVAKTLVSLLRDSGHKVNFGSRLCRVVSRESSLILKDEQGSEIEVGYLINCAGLQADRVARMCGVACKVQILPFRGEYYSLKEERAHLCKALIYPVPDLALPFLGVHLAKRIDGKIECGPNAVLAWRREGYNKGDFSFSDTSALLASSRFWRLAAKFWRVGGQEIARSYSKNLFASSLAKLVPGITAADLVPEPAGVRAQAVLLNGALADDFVIERGHRSVHVINAPSPAATACFAIGDYIASLVE